MLSVVPFNVDVAVAIGTVFIVVVALLVSKGFAKAASKTVNNE